MSAPRKSSRLPRRRAARVLRGRPLRAESLEPRQLLAGAEIAMFWRGQELLSGQTLDFGTIPPTQWHGIEKDLTIRNEGDQALTFSVPATVPTGFSLLSPSGTFSLQPDEETHVAIRLDGLPKGSPAGTFSITTNDTDESSFVLQIRGRVTGTPDAGTVRIIDDGDAGFSTTGSWQTAAGNYGGDARRIATGMGTGYGSQVASWEFNSLPSGIYRVWATWPAMGGSSSTIYYLRDSSGYAGNCQVNQQYLPSDLTADGVTWRELTDLDVRGGSLGVSLNNMGDNGSVVAADAIRIQRIGDVPSVVPFASDVEMYTLGKTKIFGQAGTGAPQSYSPPYAFSAYIREPAGQTTVNSATLLTPSGTTKTLTAPWQGADLQLQAEFGSKSTLDSTFKTGTYQFTVNTVHNGTMTASLTLPADAYPNAPHASNWTAAQSIDPTAGFALSWDAFAGGTVDDFIHVDVYIHDGYGLQIFSSPDPGQLGALDGTRTSITIPANTLAVNRTYDVEVSFINVVSTSESYSFGAVGAAAYVAMTNLLIKAGTPLPPPPPGGVIEFSAAAYSASETSPQAAITVSRTGSTQGDVQVNYATTGGTATAGVDYDAVGGTLVLADGVASQTFVIPLHDDAQSEGNETVALALSSPTGGAVLGARSTATLSILDDEISYGPGTFKDNDGDSYTVKLTGPGTARLRLADPDGDGVGPIDAIFLEGTTTASALAISVSKGRAGNGRVAIGQIVSTASATGDGSLKSLSADKADVIGDGVQLAGTVATLTLGGVTSGTIILGGSAAASSKITLGTVRVSEFRCGSTISSLTVNSLQTTSLTAPSIGALSTKAGILEGNITVAGAVKSISTKGGGASGDWTATSFGTVSISGGGFTGELISTQTAASLGKTPAIAKLTTSGDFQGTLHSLGALPNVTIGGSMLGSVVAASTMGTFGIGRNLTDSLILSGANLGADYKLEGDGASADTFGAGSFTKFSVGGNAQNSTVGAGLDPNGVFFRNGNDVIAGGAASKINSFSITGTAGSDCYFRAGTWPKTVKVTNLSVNPLADARFLDAQNLADAGETDDNGLVTLHLPLGDATFEFLDQQSGEPIPGLIVGVSMGTGTQGLAVLEALDPMQQYSPTVLMLRGPSASLTLASAAPESALALAAAPTTKYTIRQSDAAVGLALQNAFDSVGQLPSAPAYSPDEAQKTVTGIMEALRRLPRQIDDKVSGGKVQRAIKSYVETPIQVIDGNSATQQLAQSTVDDVTFGGLSANRGNTIDLSTMVGPFMQANFPKVAAMIQAGAKIYAGTANLLKSEVGELAFYLGLYSPPEPTLGFSTVTATGPGQGSPLPYTDLELYSEERLGDGEKITLDSDGNGAGKALPGKNTMIQSTQGNPPVESHPDIQPGANQVQTPAPIPEQAAKVEIITTPNPTGPLDPGTVIEVEARAYDANGNRINPGDLIHPLELHLKSPPGVDVGRLDPNGPGKWNFVAGAQNGAGRLWANSGKTMSKLRLISSLGEAAALPIVLIDDIEVLEGKAGATTTVRLNVRLSKPATTNTYVDYNSAWVGSATQGLDYKDVSGTLEFKKGSQTPTNPLPVTILGDAIAEGDETFKVGLSNPRNCRLNLKNSAVVKIKEDDKAGITAAPTSGVVTTESGGKATVKYALTSQPAAPVTITLAATAEGSLAPAALVTLAAASGTAAASVSPATLTFTATNWNSPQTVTLTGLDDSEIDGDKAYQLFVTGVSSNDPFYTASDLAKPVVSCVNRDNDALGPGKVYVKVVGNGYVTDSTGQIDTSQGHNLGTYGSNTQAIWLTAHTGSYWSDVQWVFPNGYVDNFMGPEIVTPSEWPQGLYLTVYIDSFGMMATYRAGGTTLASQRLNLMAVDAVFGQ